MDLINYVHEQVTKKKDLPNFKPGDNIAVSYKIIEGAKIYFFKDKNPN